MAAFALHAGGYKIDINLCGKNHRNGTHQYERVRLFMHDGGQCKAACMATCAEACPLLQVMECLRERAAPLELLCIKTIDGSAAAIDWSVLPGVAFSQQQAPSCVVSEQSGMHVPDMALLVRPNAAGPQATPRMPGVTCSHHVMRNTGHILLCCCIGLILQY